MKKKTFFTLFILEVLVLIAEDIVFDIAYEPNFAKVAVQAGILGLIITATIAAISILEFKKPRKKGNIEYFGIKWW